MKTCWIAAASVLALSLAACGPQAPKAGPVDTGPPPPTAAAPPQPAPSAPPAAAATAEEAEAIETAQGEAGETATAAPAPALNRGSYAWRERRVAALVENAADRDAVGDPRGEAAAARAERARCRTRGCMEASFSRQEAALMRWDGASDIVREFKR